MNNLSIYALVVTVTMVTLACIHGQGIYFIALISLWFIVIHVIGHLISKRVKDK